MKVFISYSVDDIEIVKRIANEIREKAEIYYWDKDKVPGEEAWRTIFNWIDQSDLVIVIITDKTVSRAMSVGQEIGHAKAKGKTIIPLVTPDVQRFELGCLSDITYEPIDKNNPGQAIHSLEKAINKKIKSKERDQITSVVLIALILFTCLALSESS